jgi:DNA-binding transcriptional regulator YiaG
LANIASVLKGEIARVARKEVRAETDNLKKASGRYRSEIAALKRRVIDLEQQLARLERFVSKAASVAPAAEAPSRVRFSAKGLRAQREKLGLSAATMGRLLGVSGQTIYNWEAGNTRPQAEQLAAIGSIRGIGKREANARLAVTE